MKSFKPKDDSSGDDDGTGRNTERDFHRQKRSNETYASTTDPDARLYKKADGQPSRLCLVGTALMENRNGLAHDPPHRLRRQPEMPQAHRGDLRPAMVS